MLFYGFALWDDVLFSVSPSRQGLNMPIPAWVLLIVFVTAHPTRAAFVFQNVADTSLTSPFSQITNCSLGADGTVAFEAVLKSGASGIYAVKNGQRTTIADTTQGYSFF